MSNIRKKAFVILIAFAIAAGSVFYVRSRMYFSHGSNPNGGMFQIVKGEGNGTVAAHLEQQGFVSSKVFFWLYLETHGLLNKIYPGEYFLGGNLTTAEIAAVITNPQKTFVKVTFPEGWTMKDMSGRLTNSGFNGEEFLSLAQNPPQQLKEKFSFLAEVPKGQTLEGYLFPDTYFFAKDATAENIAEKMLQDFSDKISPDILNSAAKQKKSLFEIITMASIIEKEAKYPEDMGLVSSVFWNRLAIGQRLQSDATLEYVLGTNDAQHSVAQTQLQSPYNTYQVAGLPPGPVSNPSMNAVEAALSPTKSDYYYFLTDLKTKKTVFSKTFEEHVANKAKFGL